MSLQVFQAGIGLSAALELQRRTEQNEEGARADEAQGAAAAFCFIYRALVGFFSSVPSHVDHQHVLGLEGLLLSGTILPSAHKLLLLSVDVVVVDVLERQEATQSLTRALTNTGSGFC